MYAKYGNQATTDKIRELDELREQAERLPKLVKAQREEQARARAEQQLEAAIAQATPKFAGLGQRVPVLRKRLAALMDAVKPLAKDIREAQNELIAAGKPLMTACEVYDRAYVGEQPRMGVPNNNLPPELQVATHFDEVLKAAGATNPALDFIPVGGLPEWMRVLLHAQMTDIVYHPERSSANWRRRF
jgi:hypothetical protein